MTSANMRKQLFLFFIAVLFAGIGASAAANKAYVALEESPLYILNEKGVIEEKLPVRVAKGDTVYATSQTFNYLEEHKGERIVRFPIEYQGTKAFIYVDNIHPIRLEPGDTLSYITDSKIEIGSFREQKIIPAMEWAMNVTKDPMQWIYLALIAVGCALAFSFLINLKGMGVIGLTLVGISLAVMSGAEIMYYLSYEPHALWFLKPSLVGGWGHVILNFLILSAACACQAFLFYHMWESSFTIGDNLAIRMVKKDEFDDDDDEDDDNDDNDNGILQWIIKAAFLPFLIGIAYMVLVLFSASATIYMILGATLLVAAAAGAIYQFVKGRIIQGIIFPVCFLAGSLGLIVLVMTLSIILVLVAIVGAVVGLAVALVLSAIGGFLFGGERVDFIDENGNKQSGTKQRDGLVKGDNGNLYKPRD